MNEGVSNEARVKRRLHQHEMEEASLAVLRDLLPPAWVIHDYAPDYGIDKVIEVFEPLAAAPGTSETLGQHLMIQLKSTESCDPVQWTVRERGNVAKPPTLFKVDGESRDVPVLRYSVETNLLATVARMGAAVPVVLIVVCLDKKEAYFVCVTDYVDKVLDPEEPGWRGQGTKTISVPVANRVEPDPDGVGATLLRFYSRRGKLHGLFSQVAYQFHEMGYLGELSDPRATVCAWARRLLELEVWDTPEWAILLEYAKELAEFAAYADDRADADAEVFARAQDLWRRLDVLSRNHEELCREWALPTFLAQLLSLSVTSKN
ncbi:MAG TPA: DUF4365 domain-containing protein [Acidimicrobiales bacterium]|nr:DUF4365 domain-containing protein [Acidimicrobiales bacterium]